MRVACFDEFGYEVLGRTGQIDCSRWIFLPISDDVALAKAWDGRGAARVDISCLILCAKSELG